MKNLLRFLWRNRRVRLASLAILVATIAGLSLFFVSALLLPRPFSWNSPPGGKSAAADLDADPNPLTDDELAYQKWLSHVTWRLPSSEEQEYWDIGGSQFGVDSVRYQAAFAGYAAVALGMRTPAYTEITGKILKNAIERLIDRKAWRYIGGYWKDAPGYPDPCANENIMFTGHLLQLLVFYEVMTGDASFREQGFDLVWSETEKYHYNTLTLADRIAKQMDESPTGGVACEPGWIFFSCNNHPQVALLILERMGLGNWRESRRKWETWALESLQAPLGEGAIRLLYDQNRRLFSPVGLPGGDAWSLLWYVPWADDEGMPRALWRQSRSRFDPVKVMANDGGPGNTLIKKCCMPNFPPSAVASSFLAAAARACGDADTAESFEKWLDATFLSKTAAGNHLNVGKDWRIMTTANRAMSLAIANGSDLRRFVQSPPSPAYFRGPLLAEVKPATATVIQAYRKDRMFVLEIDGMGSDVSLTFRNLPSIRTIDGPPQTAWHFDGDVLQIANVGRQKLTIHRE